MCHCLKFVFYVVKKMTRNRKRAKLKSKEPCASELKQFEPVAHSVVIESESDELMKAWVS